MGAALMMSDRIAEVLLVEDNLNDVAVAMRAFRRNHLEHRVVVVSDGVEALEYLRGLSAMDALKVVFLDVKMPRLDGWAVLREMRSDERMRRVPVVILSSSDRDPDVQQAYELGANSYVVKQFDPARPGEYLVDAARYWIGLNRAERG
jgi:two-component system response regulator